MLVILSRFYVSLFLFISTHYELGDFSRDDGNRVTLLFVGDISFSTVTKYYVEHGYHSYNDTFKEVASYIREADVSVGNLESPFVGNNTYQYMYKGPKMVLLDANPSAAAALSFAGFDAVTLANNHINDFSEEGVNFTVETIERAKIKHFGDSYGEWNSSQVIYDIYGAIFQDKSIISSKRLRAVNLEEVLKRWSWKPLIVEVKGTKIGFLGYCDTPSVNENCTGMRKIFKAGAAVYTDDIAARDVRNLKKADVDLIAVLIHFGQELQIEPFPYQGRIVKRLISLGVQIIIGAHPHVLQPHCFHNNTLVAYSLGNFLFHPRRTAGASNRNIYGRLGGKPNKKRIEAYENFALGNSEDLKKTMMLKVAVSRNRLLKAEYLPVKVTFDKKTKLLHPKPPEGSEWIKVCGKKDNQCDRQCKQKDGQTRAETNK
ncbi:Capsule biosynthesis protein CapA [Acropora cervicornis]|uniref:Capsule biosynthesis protein CapA n=1 Tax=Acropora cervicornis TaxID=6130 RepID=A0AAD9QZV2_ACRCE|nr:Capsule biosynthesis protein CapA [Acropora cervicornis]